MRCRIATNLIARLAQSPQDGLLLKVVFGIGIDTKFHPGVFQRLNRIENLADLLGGSFNLVPHQLRCDHIGLGRQAEP